MSNPLTDDPLAEEIDALAPSDGMSPEDVQAALKAMVQDAVTFDQSDLAPDRAKATRYYKGEPFGDEEEGRSKVVLTEVKDAVQGVLPSLMRVFFGSERVVEFMPRSKEDVANARQMTDYVNYVITEDNNGFLTFYEAFKDALIRRRGVIKWWWEDPETQTDEVSGLQEDQIALLKQQGVDIQIVSQQTGDDGSVTVTAHITKTLNEGRARIMAVPCEEFLHSRNARTLKDALMVAHRRDMRRSELVELGISDAILDEHGGQGSNLETSEDAIARAPKGNVMADESSDESTKLILYTEAYVYLDEDGDGKAEHRRICMVGEGCTVVHDDLWPERPFALYVPDPEPHTLVGLGLSDSTMDLQNISSHVFRYTLDSLSRTLFPRQAFDENRVNMTDIANTENGAGVRVRGDPNTAIKDMVTPFVGDAAMNVLGYVDSLKEKRTGQTKASAGLDPDALQSSTRQAVEATVQAAQQRLELLCRIFAETGHKQLMRGLARLLHRHQPKERLVKLRNDWVPVDPQSWDPDQDVTVSVALGTGQVEHRLQLLAAIAGKQEQLLQTLGPSNPAVGLPQLLNTYREVIEMSGKKDTEKYFNFLPADWQFPQQPPKPTVEEVLAEVERMKVQADIAIKQADQALKREQMLMEDDRARDQMRGDFFLKAYEIEAKTGVEVDKLELDRIIAAQHTVEGA